MEMPVKLSMSEVRVVMLALSIIVLFTPPVLAQPKDSEATFKKWDKNGDDGLTRDELPKNVRRNFDKVDENKDGIISLAEHKRFLSSRRRAESLPEGTVVLRDISYVDNGHPRQRLDIYLPEAKEKSSSRPLVMWIHGGAWRGGNKEHVPELAALLKRGFAVASLNYRLSQHARFPAQIHDCKAGVRYLRKNAKLHGINPDRIGVWGSSAGGHLVALLGTSGDVRELEGAVGVTGPSSRVQAVCDWFGPTELLKMNAQAPADSVIDHDADDSPESRLIGGPIQQNQEATRKADPVRYVTRDEPPFLIMHGNRDRLVPYQQSETLHRLLKEAKVRSELLIIQGAGHGFGDPQDKNRPVDFFVRELMR